MKKLLAIVPFFLLALSANGQATYQVEKLNWDGPLLGDNRYARIQLLRSIDPTGRLPDEVLYVDRNGTKFDSQRSVRKVIDAFLPQVAPISHWAPSPPVKKLGFGKEDYIPYDLHILTIAPIVVLAVPRGAEMNEYCSGQFFAKGIIFSDVIFTCYSYLARPAIVPGSFWFSPTLEKGAQFLTETVQTHSIPLGETKLLLNANGKNWDVQRVGKLDCPDQHVSCAISRDKGTRYQITSDGDEVVDTWGGLVWRRCLQGTIWNGTACEGKIALLSYANASALEQTITSEHGKKWRLPELNELGQIGSHLLKSAAFPESSKASCWVRWNGAKGTYPTIKNCSSASDFNGAAPSVEMAVRWVRSER